MQLQENKISKQVGQILRQERTHIISLWEQRARHEVDAAKSASPLSLVDSLPQFIDQLAAALEWDDSKASGDVAYEHAKERDNLGTYTLEQVISEYQILREVVIQTLVERVPLDELSRRTIHAFLDQGMQKAAARFSDSQLRAREQQNLQIENERQRLRDVFAQSPVGMILFLGPDLRVQFLNDPFLQISRRFRKEMLGLTLDELLQKELPETSGYADLVRQVYQTAKPFIGKEVPYQNTDADGKLHEYWLDVAYYPYYEGGQVIGVLSFSTDVTDKVLIRKQIEASERRLQGQATMFAALLSSTFDMIYLFNCELRLVYANPAQLRSWGCSLESAIGKTIEEICCEVNEIDSKALNLLIQDFRQVLNGHTIRTVTPFLTTDGRKGFYESVSSPVYDEGGKITGLTGAARDITEQMRSQSLLQNEKQKLQSIFSNSPAAMALWRGPEHIFEMVNSEYQRIFGKYELVGRSFAEAVPELKRQGFQHLMDGVFASGETYVGHEQMAQLSLTKEGALQDVFFDFTIVRLEDANEQPYGVYVHVIDVTDKVQARQALARVAEELRVAKEDAERANSLKSAFLANMSHEIRTPLGAIVGFGELLKDRRLDAVEREQYIDTIVRNGNSLNRIIDDILDLAKVEAGRLEIEQIEFSLYDLVVDVVDLFRDKAKEKSIFLLLNIDENVPLRIVSDPTRLRQILVNLIGNAIKFTEAGGVRISVRASRIAESSFAIGVDVKDTGVGLSDEQKAKLFQPFVQADNSMTRKYGGTGLGLVLSQRLAHALNGQITIPSSAPGKGSTFSFEFQSTVLAESMSHKVPTLENNFRNSQNLSGLKILVVDDSSDNLFLVQHLLAKNGASVDTAHDGREGSQKALSGSHDVVLMDIQMPNMDGYQAKKYLDEHGYQAPVIALTAHAMKEEEARAQSAGFSGYLKKPLVIQDLIQTVSRIGKHLH